MDARIGVELRSQERWAGLRAKLEALRDRSPADAEAAYTAYGEVTDLLLALHRKVRESSGLGRDPGADSFFLQDSVGAELPEAMVAAGRLADLGALASRRPAAERVRTLMELTGLRVAALAPASDVVDNLRAAVDSSESTDLGANVLTPLDAYQRSVEALARVLDAERRRCHRPGRTDRRRTQLADRRAAAPTRHPRRTGRACSPSGSTG